MRDSQNITVMVTGVGGGGLGEQLIKALRLADTHYTIVGGDIDANSYGFQLVEHPCVLPAASDAAYIQTVLAVCKKYEVKAVLAGSEAEIKTLSAHRQLLEQEGLLLPLNPASVLDICLDKVRTMSFLADHGFKHPRYLEVSTPEDLRHLDFFPAVLKPSVGGGGSANILLVQSQEEAEVLGKYLLNLVPKFICQEYVGTPQDEYTVGVLLDLEGRLINSIALRRSILSGLSNRIKVPNRTGRAELGDTLAISSGVSQGEVGSFPEVTKPCEQIALALGCTGSVNIQCRLVEGHPYVFEINPRFSGTTSIRALAGYNEPDILLRRHLLGVPIEPDFPYSAGFAGRGLRELFWGNKPSSPCT